MRKYNELEVATMEASDRINVILHALQGEFSLAPEKVNELSDVLEYIRKRLNKALNQTGIRGS